jgi:hypothetical protein
VPVGERDGRAFAPSISVCVCCLRLPDPMLSRSEHLHSGSGWCFELKWDGEDEERDPLAPSEPSPFEPESPREPRDDNEHEDEQQDRAPQPGVTPALDDD